MELRVSSAAPENRIPYFFVSYAHDSAGDDDLLVRQFFHHLRADVRLYSDEVYEHILFDGARHESVARYPDLAERAVVISSFGKTYHTTGWKVGYCAAPPALTTEIQRVHQWVTFAVNGAVQMAYADMVARDPGASDVTAFYQGRRDRFLGLVAGSGVFASARRRSASSQSDTASPSIPLELRVS